MRAEERRSKPSGMPFSGTDRIGLSDRREEASGIPSARSHSKPQRFSGQQKRPPFPEAFRLFGEEAYSFFSYSFLISSTEVGRGLPPVQTSAKASLDS